MDSEVKRGVVLLILLSHTKAIGLKADFEKRYGLRLFLICGLRVMSVRVALSAMLLKTCVNPVRVWFKKSYSERSFAKHC